MSAWRRRLLAAPVLLALITGAAPAASAATAHPAAPAASSPLTITGGSATTVSAPGVAGKLLGAGIIPIVLPPASMNINFQNLTATITVPLTSGSIDLSTFNGTVAAGGTMIFTKLLPLRAVRLTDIEVNIVNGQVSQTAMTASGTRIALFDLSLAGAQFGGDATHLTISNLTVTMDPQGAQYLDSKLHTSVFTPGMVFGTATSTFQHT